MKFVIERYAYFGTSYTLRLPLIPCVPWFFRRHDVGTRHNDDLRPNDDDANNSAKGVIASKRLRYGKKVADNATFEFKDTYGT